MPTVAKEGEKQDGTVSHVDLRDMDDNSGGCYSTLNGVRPTTIWYTMQPSAQRSDA